MSEPAGIVLIMLFGFFLFSAAVLAFYAWLSWRHEKDR